jgi:hypothetical protein
MCFISIRPLDCRGQSDQRKLPRKSRLASDLPQHSPEGVPNGGVVVRRVRKAADESVQCHPSLALVDGAGRSSTMQTMFFASDLFPNNGTPSHAPPYPPRLASSPSLGSTRQRPRSLMPPVALTPSSDVSKPTPRSSTRSLRRESLGRTSLSVDSSLGLLLDEASPCRVGPHGTRTRSTRTNLWRLWSPTFRLGRGGGG